MKKLPDTTLLGVEIPVSALASRKLFIQLGLLIAISVTVWLWIPILSAQRTENTLYVLDIGQGDSQLVVLASEDKRSSIKVLIDGGKDRAVLNELDRVLGTSNNKYVDVVFMTHTDLDHMGGLVEVLKRYDIGLFVSNGRSADSEVYATLQDVLTERNIPSAVLLAGDKIRYGEHVFSIMSPDTTLLRHKEVNEAGIVMRLDSNADVLFTGDIGFPAENALLRKEYDLSADVLKVGHHGSKYSSSENFIASVRPTVAVIGVGKNSYGHPTPRVLETLELSGSHVYRTDSDGTIRIPLDRETVIEERAPNTGLLASIASILTGSYKRAHFTEVSLAGASEEKKTSNLVPYKTCTFRTGGVPRHSPVIMSEIAWMGAESGATHEWIELRNVSGTGVNLSGWQILNENERIHFTFPQKSVLESPYMVLARSAVKESVDAKFVFTGSLRNSNEGLRLYDNECNLIDEVPVSSSWSAGDNKTKQTMERASDLSWKTSQNPDGTPGR